jgi:hypothetical protein
MEMIKYTGQSAKFSGYIRKPKKMWQDPDRMTGICNPVPDAGRHSTIMAEFSATVPVS